MKNVIASITMIFLMGPVVAWSDSANNLPRPAIVVLGDSLSDGAAPGNRKGNNNWLHSEGRSEQTGLGAPVTNWPKDDPSTWVNYMAETFFPGEQSMGFLFQCPRFHHQPLILNAAFASAETGDNYVNDLGGKKYDPVESRCNDYGYFWDYSCVPGVIKQIELVSNTEVNWSKTAVAVWAGTNDLFNDIAKLQSIFGDNLDKESVVDRKLNQLKSANAGLTEASFDQFFKELAGDKFDELHFSNPIKNTREIVDILVNKNSVPVDNILVIGLPDLGQLPVSSGSKLFSSLLSFLSLGYNEALKNLVLHDYIKKGLTFVDIREWQRNQVNDPAWVQDALKRTCLSDNQQELCIEEGSDAYTGTPYLFFDHKHPTVIAHKKLWDEILRQIKAVNSTSAFTHPTNSARP